MSAETVVSLADRREAHRDMAAKWCTAPDGPCDVCVESVPKVLASVRGTRTPPTREG